MLEDFGVPAPGETLLVSGAIFAGLGRLDLALVLLAGFVGAVVGDNIGFCIGSRGGRPLVRRWGPYVLLPPERLRRVERFFARYGGAVVAIARFVEGLRQANGIVAGLSDMDWRRFLLWNALGAMLWVGFWGGAGYFAAGEIAALHRVLGPWETRIWIGLAALLPVAVLAHGIASVWRRHRHAQ